VHRIGTEDNTQRRKKTTLALRSFPMLSMVAARPDTVEEDSLLDLDTEQIPDTARHRNVPEHRRRSASSHASFRFSDTAGCHAPPTATPETRVPGEAHPY
jgi:hypothetical protein